MTITRKQIGKFRHLVSFEAPNETKTPAGTPDGWHKFIDAWADVQELSTRPRESVAGNVLQSDVNVMIHTRFIDGVRPNMRIKFEGTIFNIKTVVDLDGRHQYLEMWCVEVQ